MRFLTDEDIINRSCNLTEQCQFPYVDDEQGTGMIQKLCYSQVSWSEDTNFCDCYFWYGYTGDYCDQVTPMVIYYRTSLITFIIWSAIAFLVLFYDIWFLIYIKIVIFFELSPKYIGLKAEKTSLPYSVLLVGSTTLVYYLSVFGHAAIHIKSLFDPTRFEVIPDDSFEEVGGAVTVVGGRVALSLTSLTLPLALTAQLQLSLSWLKLTDRMKRFNFFGTKGWSRAIKYYKIFAQLMTFAAFVLVISVPFTTAYILFRLIAPILLVVVVALVWIGRRRFVKIVDSLTMYDNNIANEAKKRYAKPLSLVKSTSLWTVILTGIGIILNLIYIVLRNYVNVHLEPGKFNYELFVSHVSLVVALSLFHVYHYYFRSLVQGLKNMMKSSDPSAKTKTKTKTIKQEQEQEQEIGPQSPAEAERGQDRFIINSQTVRSEPIKGQGLDIIDRTSL